MPGFIVVQADAHIADEWPAFHRLPQHLVRNAAGRGIAAGFPVLFVHGNKRQHINRSFKQEQGIPAADPVKAVFRLTAGGISLEAALCSSAVLVNVPWFSLPVCAHEYGVVVICGFIDKTSVGKSIQHLLVDAPVSKQVAVDPAHVLVLWWNL